MTHIIDYGEEYTGEDTVEYCGVCDCVVHNPYEEGFTCPSMSDYCPYEGLKADKNYLPLDFNDE